MPSIACRRRSGAAGFTDVALRVPRWRLQAAASPRTYQPLAGARARFHAKNPLSGTSSPSAGHYTTCVSDSISAQRSPPACTLRPSSCPLPSESRSGAVSPLLARHPSSDRTSCPASSVLADPLNQPGPKPAGQVLGNPATAITSQSWVTADRLSEWDRCYGFAF